MEESESELVSYGYNSHGVFPCIGFMVFFFFGKGKGVFNDQLTSAVVSLVQCSFVTFTYKGVTIGYEGILGPNFSMANRRNEDFFFPRSMFNFVMTTFSLVNWVMETYA